MRPYMFMWYVIYPLNPIGFKEVCDAINRWFSTDMEMNIFGDIQVIRKKRKCSIGYIVIPMIWNWPKPINANTQIAKTKHVKIK